jgi:AcrR family transcriptional regulator
MGSSSERNAPTPLSSFRLPPGRHGIPSAEVAENQRWRLIGAAAEVLREQGHVRTTSTRVARRAGVSPATFYVHFENIGDCLLASFVTEIEAVRRTVSKACEEAELSWRERLGIAVASTLRFLAVEPAMAHMLGPEAAAGLPEIPAARASAVEEMAELLASGRELRPRRSADLPPGTERHLVSAALATVGAWIDAGEAERLPELAPAISEMLSAPYSRPRG